ncbi:FG-GAP-like repeat-containing protein [bacterium]|nr:FG-GAP-like repeat-containing protein [bacterium]
MGSGILSVGVAMAVLCAAVHAQFHVAQVTPSSEAVSTSALGNITWALSAPVDPATVNASSVNVWGRWGGAMDGTYFLESGNTVIRFVPTHAFSAGEMVTARLNPTLLSASGIALSGSHTTQYWIAAMPAVPALSLQATIDVRFPGEGLIRSYGAYAGDLNNDGYPDLLIPNEDVNDVRRFMNDGSGGFSAFTVHSLPSGSKPSANEGADFNGDGWTDFAVANITSGTVAVFLNDGAGDLLTPVLIPVGNGPRGLTVLDADSDGDTDIVTANRISGTLSLILNNGDGTFQPSTSLQFGFANETAIAAVDANSDGIMDLYVGAYGSRNVAMLLGDGSGNFSVSSTIAVGGSPWMIATGDVDSDGHVDVVACLADTSQVAVIRNDGSGGLLPPVKFPCGTFPTAIDLGDLDGDGDLDIVASSYLSSNYSVFRNLGDGTFGAAAVLPAVAAGSCAILADINGDEDIEVIGVDELADQLFIFDSPPLQPQKASIGCSLRINDVGEAPGFAGASRLRVARGSRLTISVSGHPGGLWFMPIGTAVAPGLPTPAGVLALGADPLFLVNGLSNASYVLDDNGKASVSLRVAQWLPSGFAITLQGMAVNPANRAVGVTFSNPMTVVMN